MALTESLDARLERERESERERKRERQRDRERERERSGGQEADRSHCAKSLVN